MKTMTRLLVVGLALMGCIGLLVGEVGAKMYDTPDEPPAKVTPPQKGQCGSPPPVVCYPYPFFDPYMVYYPGRGYGTYLDDTRRGIQFLDISSGK